CTLEELHLAGALLRGLGSHSIDTRLRAADYRHAAPAGAARWLGLPIAELSTLERVLVIGSNLRKDHPLLAQRIRQAQRRGAQVSAMVAKAPDWALPLAHALVADAGRWPLELAGIAAAVAQAQGIAPPVPSPEPVSERACAIAASLLGGERKALLLGNAAAHHEQASSLLALAQWIAERTGARWGTLSEAANTVGAQLVQALPGTGGLNATQILSGAAKAVLLLNAEVGLDTAVCGKGLAQAQMVVSLSPFKSNLDHCDVLLPIAPFTETSGSFVNAEGRLQSFHAVVRPLGEARPAWKVLRVLGQMLGLPGFDADSSQAVLAQALPGVASGQCVPAERLDNRSQATIDLTVGSATPCVASIYQLDALVRRAPSLQQTADARAARASAQATQTGDCA
ncbi:MAG: molybdopterin-dependent oxidoreductase, partial [Serpentinimonas sp.]|nr:molybdopterin-dependent oxidoreductase [Serpentinimonas sp.]